MNRTRTFTLFLAPLRSCDLSARIAQTPRSRRRDDEIALKLEVSVPDTLFKRQELRAIISVPEGKPAIIDAAVTENISDIIRRETGIDVKLTVESPDA